jgi:hypothetical protein
MFDSLLAWLRDFLLHHPRVGLPASLPRARCVSVVLGEGALAEEEEMAVGAGGAFPPSDAFAPFAQVRHVRHADTPTHRHTTPRASSTRMPQRSWRGSSACCWCECVRV